MGKIQVTADTKISEVKKKIQGLKKGIKVERQSIRAEAKGKSLKDSDTLKSLNIANRGKLYLKDLGPQISWKGVFLAEYAGPLLLYLWVYQRPWIFYNNSDSNVVSVTATLVFFFSILNEFICNA